MRHDDESTKKARFDSASIGNVLIALRHTTQEQIDKVLAADTDKRLGDALVAADIITEEQLQSALTHQSILRGKIKPKDASKFMFAESKRVMDSITEGFDGLTDTNRLVLAKLRAKP